MADEVALLERYSVRLEATAAAAAVAPAAFEAEIEEVASTGGVVLAVVGMVEVVWEQEARVAS